MEVEYRGKDSGLFRREKKQQKTQGKKDSEGRVKIQGLISC